MFYHYTCEHGRTALGTSGSVRTLADWNPRTAARVAPERTGISLLSWFTDLDVPVREALGLSSMTIECDRTAYRYRVTDDSEIMPWLTCPLRRGWMMDLERAEGALPRHWYIATVPVPVILS